jgi:cytochrome P450/NADPH-cytochrome P450 reductase
MAATVTDDSIREKFTALAGDNFEKEITNTRRSPLDLLEEYPSVALSFGEFLSMVSAFDVSYLIIVS